MTAPPTTNEPDVIPRSPACPDCNGAGWYLMAVPVGDPRFGKLQPCHCKREEQARRAAERKLTILGRLHSELGELAHCTFDTFQIECARDAAARRSLIAAFDAACYYLDRKRGWLYLHGPCGVGKSHLAAAIAHQAAEEGLRASYVSAPALLRFVKAGFGDRSSDDRIQALQLVDLLIVDDLGAEYHSRNGDYGDQLLFELINYRYLYNGLTVLTSNLPPEELEPRIASRIRGRSRVLFVDNNDQRGRGEP